jgi:hypothetical protein
MAKEKQIKDIKERVKSFEDALAVTGRPALPDFSNVPEDLRDYFEAQYKVVVIAEALNEGCPPNYTNDEQPKWFPWFRVSSSGFVFNDALYYSSRAAAGDGSRLCLKNSELARYFGEQFIEIWNKFLLK